MMVRMVMVVHLIGGMAHQVRIRILQRFRTMFEEMKLTMMLVCELPLRLFRVNQNGKGVNIVWCFIIVRILYLLFWKLIIGFQNMEG